MRRLLPLLLLALALPVGASPPSLRLSSPVLAEGRPVPREFTCDGLDVSPPLVWKGAPAGTKEFVVTMKDPDAPGGTFVHWLAFGIPGTAPGLPRGAPAGGGVAFGLNDFGKSAYGGPCPPKGPAHRYVFEVLALGRPSGLAAGATADQVEKAVSGHVLGQARLVATYGRR